MPARPCQRRAAAWCLLLCLAPFAPGQGDADSTSNQGRLSRPLSLSTSSGLSDQLGTLELREAVAGRHANADHSSSQHASASGQVMLSYRLPPVRGSQRRRSLVAYSPPRRLLAESGAISPAIMSAPMPAPGTLTSPKPCAFCCWSLCLAFHLYPDTHGSHKIDNCYGVHEYAACQAWQSCLAMIIRPEELQELKPLSSTCI